VKCSDDTDPIVADIVVKRDGKEIRELKDHEPDAGKYSITLRHPPGKHTYTVVAMREGKGTGYESTGKVGPGIHPLDPITLKMAGS